MKKLIIIPTLNEEGNISKLLEKIIKLKLNFTVLIIDDNSKDLTRKKILYYNKKYNFVKYVFRSKRLGIGSAHKCGFKWALKNKFDLCVTIDADLTHNPFMIKKMLNVLNSNKALIVNTSRFLKNDSLKSWPLPRIIITWFRYVLVRIILKTKFDSSGGFRLYNLRKIKKKHLFLAKNNSYFFLIESLFYYEQLKYKIQEIPIVLPYRLYGSSKMRLKDIFDSFLNLIKLKLNKF